MQKKNVCLYATWEARPLGNDVTVGIRRYYLEGVVLVGPAPARTQIQIKVGSLVKIWNNDVPQRVWAVWAPINGAAVNLSLQDDKIDSDTPYDCPFQNVVEVVKGPIVKPAAVDAWLEREKSEYSAKKAKLSQPVKDEPKIKSKKRPRPPSLPASTHEDLAAVIQVGADSLAKVLKEDHQRQANLLQQHLSQLIKLSEDRLQAEMTLFERCFKAFSSK